MVLPGISCRGHLFPDPVRDLAWGINKTNTYAKNNGRQYSTHPVVLCDPSAGILSKGI
jgi:hypothetical protein